VFPRVKAPDELDIICEDLKVCGRRELFALLKFRHKYQRLIDIDRKKVKSDIDKAANAAKQLEKNDSDLEAEQDKELEDTIKRVEKDRKRQDKKDRERKVKAELRAKMSVIASTDIYNQNDEVLFDKRTLERMKKIDIEELDYEDDGNDDEDPEGKGITKIFDGKRDAKQGNEDKGNESDVSLDPEQRRLEEMAAGMDEYYKR